MIVEGRQGSPASEEIGGDYRLVSRDRHPTDGVLEPRFGEAFWQFSPELRNRLRLQEETQKTGEDEEVCVEIINNVNEKAREINPELVLTPEQLNRIKWATRITDIGKTAPLNATPGQQHLVASLYAIEREFPKAKNLMSMRDYLALTDVPPTNAQLDERMAILEQMGLAGLNVEEFINLHASWTWDLIKNEQAIPKGARVTAALHHLLEGNNPEGLVDLSNDELWIPSLDRSVGTEEIVTILNDKYQARRRFVDKKLGRLRTHDEQITWLNNFLTNPGWVKLNPYPDWLKEQALDYVEVLRQTGPFPQYFKMDRQVEAEPSTEEIFGQVA